jgi:hypothetical protein
MYVCGRMLVDLMMQDDDIYFNNIVFTQRAMKPFCSPETPVILVDGRMICSFDRSRTDGGVQSTGIRLHVFPSHRLWGLSWWMCVLTIIQDQ